MRAALLFVAAVTFLASASCASSSSPATGVVVDSGTTVATPDGGGAELDAAPPGCGNPSVLPDMPCGALSWKASDITTRKRNHHVTFEAETKAGAFLYALGGFDGQTSVLPNVDRAPIHADGSLGAWVADRALTVAMGGHTGSVASNVMVVAGGMSASGALNTSYSAVIGDDGSLGAWKPAGALPHPRMHGASFSSGSSVYVLGGFQNPKVWDDVLRATVQPDGTISPWTSAGTLPGPRSHFSCSFVDGYVYIAGGLDKSAYTNPPDLLDVQRAHLADDGTLVEWTKMPSLLTGMATHASFFYGGYLYVAGGINSAPEQENRVWRAPIGADHALGAWALAAPLGIARGHVHQLPVRNGHVYSVGGAIDFDLNSTSEIDIGVFQ